MSNFENTNIKHMKSFQISCIKLVNLLSDYIFLKHDWRQLHSFKLLRHLRMVTIIIFTELDPRRLVEIVQQRSFHHLLIDRIAVQRGNRRCIHIIRIVFYLLVLYVDTVHLVGVGDFAQGGLLRNFMRVGVSCQRVVCC